MAKLINKRLLCTSLRRKETSVTHNGTPTYEKKQICGMLVKMSYNLPQDVYITFQVRWLERREFIIGTFVISLKHRIRNVVHFFSNRKKSTGGNDSSIG